MRALVLCLALSACATVETPAPPNERVAGCWINRDAGAVTMRWLPDRGGSGALVGSKVAYGVAGNRLERYTLAQSAEGWRLCQTAPEQACWAVAEGDMGSLEGGRAFIDATGESLRIAVIGAGAERVIFQGRRDGCD